MALYQDTLKYVYLPSTNRFLSYRILRGTIPAYLTFVNFDYYQQQWDNMASEDPYEILTQSVKRLNAPLERLLKTHDEFVLQNLTILNNIKSVSSVREKLTTNSR